MNYDKDTRKRVTLKIIISVGHSPPEQSQEKVGHHVALAPTEPAPVSDLYKVLLLIYPLSTLEWMTRHLWRKGIKHSNIRVEP